MDQLPALGTDLKKQFATPDIYGPLLAQNADAILKTKKETHKYGPHSRHELDVYYPKEKPIPVPRADASASAGANLDIDADEDFEPDTDDPPVLIFLHAGGLVAGDRVIESKPTPGLVYTNLGHYFAEKCGYITVVISYRLVNQHDAKFPTGGEDIAHAVKWVKENLALDSRARNLFLIGHSAGGIHVATYLLAPQFETDVAAVTGDRKQQPVRLRGAILLSAPLHFQLAEEWRAELLKAYFAERLEEDAPLGLLKAYQQRHPNDFPLAGVQVLVIDATLDIENDIRVPATDFLGQWLKAENQAMKDHILYREIEGHNHFSTVYALGTGIEKEEAWAEEVSGFIESIRRHDQVQRNLQALQDTIKKPPPQQSAKVDAQPE